MNLKGAEIARYLARPDPTRPGLLIHGADAMRVALKRAEAVRALVGDNAEQEMRLTRLPGAGLRKDPAQLLDAVKAVGFFPGPRVVLVDDTPDAAAPAIQAALDEWAQGDAVIVVVGGALTKSSALRKLFEGHRTAMSAPIYDDPPGEQEITRWLSDAGLPQVPRDAMRDLVSLSRVLDPGDFRQTIEKIALYKLGDATPLTPQEIAALMPASIEAATDDLLAAVADGRADAFAGLMRRIEAQGTQPVALCIATLRHFRALHLAASHPDGPAQGVARLRPPAFGPRRDRMIRQATRWGMADLETALRQIIDTDLRLRSSSRAPAMALVERLLLRLTMMKRAAR